MNRSNFRSNFRGLDADNPDKVRRLIHSVLYGTLDEHQVDTLMETLPIYVNIFILGTDKIDRCQ